MATAQRGPLTPAQLVGKVLANGADRIAVTGATGWFGRTTLELLYEVLGESAAQRVRAYGSRSGRIELSSRHSLSVHPLSDLISDVPSPTVVLHYAYLTRDRAGELAPAQYLEANRQITATVLQAISQHRPRLVVTTSSGAAVQHDGVPGSDLERNPYGALKRLDEAAFAQSAAQIGAGYAIPRVYSVAGPWMTKPEKYALGSMITMALRGGPVEVRANRQVVRSYCSVAEVVATSLWAAANDHPGVFDSGGHVLEMGELAEIVSRVVGQGCEVVRAALDPSLPGDTYLGELTDMAHLAAACGLQLADADELVRATAAELAARQVRVTAIATSAKDDRP